MVIAKWGGKFIAKVGAKRADMESAPTEFCGLELILQPNSRSYGVETSNPLTSFVDFRFKDKFDFGKQNSAIHIFRFTNFISHIRSPLFM